MANGERIPAFKGVTGYVEGFHTGTRQQTITTKGAPEAIFDLCHLADDVKATHARAVEELAASGLRVLGVAKAVIGLTNLPEIQHDFDFQFVGLIGLSDPIRENVQEAVTECYKAGIRTIMITGDYPVTAKSIAKISG